MKDSWLGHARIRTLGIPGVSFLAVFLLAIGLSFAAPAAPPLPATASSMVDADGELRVLHEDDFKGKTSRTRYWLKSSQGQVELKFKRKPPALLTGTKVHVRGQMDGGLLVLDDGGATTSVQVIAPTLTNTFGQQNTLVLLVNFQDQPANQPWTVAEIRDLFFGTVGRYYAEASYQQTWLVGDAYGWFTVASSSTICDTAGIASASVKAAAAAGIDVSAYARRVYVFPYNANCHWSGQGTIGGSPSEAWINGTIDSGIAAHELGHNFGLYHSHALQCSAGAMGGTCSAIEYGDTLDVMGGSQGHFNAFQKENLGWLGYGASPPVTTVAASGTYALSSYETYDANPKALKILRNIDATTGTRSWYYVEYREPIGFDAFIATSMPLNRGIVVHTASDGSANSSDLLDMTPGSSSYADWNDVPLLPGQTFTDSDAGLAITTLGADGTAASVYVALSQPACMRATPTISVSPASQAAAPGTPLSYAVVVTDHDGASCPSASFALLASLPNGWTGVFTAPTLSLLPGASASTNLTVTSSSTTSPSNYGFGVSVTNAAGAGYSASASATYQVSTGSVVPATPVVTVSTNQPSYSGGQSVVVKASVISGGQPVAGAGVNVTIKPPNGKAIAGAVMTDAGGVASYTMKLARKPAKGTYSVTGVASTAGTSASGSATFLVQ